MRQEGSAVRGALLLRQPRGDRHGVSTPWIAPECPHTKQLPNLGNEYNVTLEQVPAQRLHLR